MVNNFTNISKTSTHDNMALDIRVLLWDRHKYVAELNRLMWTQHSSLYLLYVYCGIVPIETYLCKYPQY